MKRFKKLVWRIPGAFPLGHKIVELRRRRMTGEEVFADIHRRTRWGGQVSVSGRGSDPDQTARIERELPRLLHDLEVRTPLDLRAPPFALPPPERVVVERCTQGGGRYADKSLGLWPVGAVAEAWSGLRRP